MPPALARDLAAAPRRRARLAGRLSGRWLRDNTEVAQEGLYLSIMGDLGAWRDGHPIPLGREKPRTVLGVLAVQPGVWVHALAWLLGLAQVPLAHVGSTV